MEVTPKVEREGIREGVQRIGDKVTHGEWAGGYGLFLHGAKRRHRRLAVALEFLGDLLRRPAAALLDQEVLKVLGNWR